MIGNFCGQIRFRRTKLRRKSSKIFEQLLTSLISQPVLFLHFDNRVILAIVFFVSFEKAHFTVLTSQHLTVSMNISLIMLDSITRLNSHDSFPLLITIYPRSAQLSANGMSANSAVCSLRLS